MKASRHQGLLLLCFPKTMLLQNGAMMSSWRSWSSALRDATRKRKTRGGKWASWVINGLMIHAGPVDDPRRSRRWSTNADPWTQTHKPRPMNLDPQTQTHELRPTNPNPQNRRSTSNHNPRPSVEHTHQRSIKKEERRKKWKRKEKDRRERAVEENKKYFFFYNPATVRSQIWDCTIAES